MGKKSKIIIGILILVILAFGGIFLKRKTVLPVVDTSINNNKKTSMPILITKEDIKETNFTGSRSVIHGQSLLAETSQLYIEKTIKEFKQSADEDVPSMRTKFGLDSPLANYSLDINATYTKSQKTESIIIDQYAYTGGANGNSSYKVFTASISTGRILSFADIIQTSKKEAFTALVKKELANWRPDKSQESVVFPDELKTLIFNSFTNWSYDNNNLVLYFDKYAIAPGALGSIAFPLPLSKIKDFLK